MPSKSTRPKQAMPTATPKPAEPSNTAGKAIVIPFCTSVTEKAVQVLIATIADQLAKDVAQITLLIAANGGYSGPAYHLYQFLRALTVPLHTHATGEVSGLGLLPFLAGQERLAVRSARFLLTAARGYTVEDGRGPLREVDESPVQIDPYYAEIVLNGGTLEADELNDIHYRQAWKSAGWAKRHGLVTRIADLKLLSGGIIVQPSYL